MTKTTDYNLEYLIGIFNEHAIKTKREAEAQLNTYKENYPGEPVPLYMSDPFNLSLALCVMASEIQRIKDLFAIKNLI